MTVDSAARANAALAALQVRDPGVCDAGIGLYDREALRQVLVAVVCPAPCVGEVRPDNTWHQVCEETARAALAALDRDRPGAWGLNPPA